MHLSNPAITGIAATEMRPAPRTPGKQDRTAGSQRHTGNGSGVCRLGTACGADGPAGRGRECAPVVRVDVSHSKTRNTGVAEMTMSNVQCSMSKWCAVVVALLLLPVA